MISQISPAEKDYYRSARESVGAIYSGPEGLEEISQALAEGCFRELETGFMFDGSVTGTAGLSANQARAAATHNNYVREQAFKNGTTVLGPMIEITPESGLRVVTGHVAGIWVLRDEYGI